MTKPQILPHIELDMEIFQMKPKLNLFIAA